MLDKYLLINPHKISPKDTLLTLLLVLIFSVESVAAVQVFQSHTYTSRPTVSLLAFLAKFTPEMIPQFWVTFEADDTVSCSAGQLWV